MYHLRSVIELQSLFQRAPMAHGRQMADTKSKKTRSVITYILFCDEVFLFFVCYHCPLLLLSLLERYDVFKVMCPSRFSAVGNHGLDFIFDCFETKVLFHVYSVCGLAVHICIPIYNVYKC